MLVYSLLGNSNRIRYAELYYANKYIQWVVKNSTVLSDSANDNDNQLLIFITLYIFHWLQHTDKGGKNQSEFSKYWNTWKLTVRFKEKELFIAIIT